MNRTMIIALLAAGLLTSPSVAAICDYDGPPSSHGTSWVTINKEHQEGPTAAAGGGEVRAVQTTAQGACCLPPQARDPNHPWCQRLSQADCTAAGGMYQGDDTACVPCDRSLCAPAVCRGDCNCDGAVGFADIDLFVAGIPNNQAAWAAKYQLYYGTPPPAWCWENTDVNGILTPCGFDDIDPFVKLIPTPCTLRACCFPDHTCQDLLPGDCLIAGGTFFPGPAGNQPCSLTTCRPPGDICLNALSATVPGTFTGTTVGFTDDYDEVCPFAGSTSPDVVYEYVPDRDLLVSIDLCASGYDTKVYVYQDDCVAGTAVACNDDDSVHCTNYRSYLAGVPVYADHVYYIVIDGYGGASGNYSMTLSEYQSCALECPSGGVPEGEPDCGPNYIDNYNGGCGSEPVAFQPIACGQTICGKSGTYLFGTSNYRDTDWYEVVTAETVMFTWTVRAEFPVFTLVITPEPDCSQISYVWASALECEDATIVTDCRPPGTYWFWVGPSAFDGLDCGADYVATLTCMPCLPLAGGVLDPHPPEEHHGGWLAPTRSLNFPAPAPR